MQQRQPLHGRRYFAPYIFNIWRVVWAISLRRLSGSNTSTSSPQPSMKACNCTLIASLMVTSTEPSGCGSVTWEGCHIVSSAIIASSGANLNFTVSISPCTVMPQAGLRYSLASKSVGVAVVLVQQLYSLNALYFENADSTGEVAVSDN